MISRGKFDVVHCSGWSHHFDKMQAFSSEVEASQKFEVLEFISSSIGESVGGLSVIEMEAESVCDNSECIQYSACSPVLHAPAIYNLVDKCKPLFRHYAVAVDGGCFYPNSGTFMPFPGRYWLDSLRNDVRFQFDRLLSAAGHVDSETRFEFLSPEDIPCLEGVYLCLFSAHRNYSHWMTDNISAVSYFLDQILAGRLKIVCFPLSSWQRRSLELLGVPNDSIVEVDCHVVRCERLVFPSTLSTAQTGYPGGLVLSGLNKLAAAATSAHREFGLKLYVSREDTGVSGRYLENSDELWRALEGQGFIKIVPGKLSLDQQIDYFRRADIVVAPHGAGNINVGFCQKGTALIEIFGELYFHNVFFNLAAKKGLAYAYVIGDAEASQCVDAGYSTDVRAFSFSVDVDRVLDVVNEVGHARRDSSGLMHQKSYQSMINFFEYRKSVERRLRSNLSVEAIRCKNKDAIIRKMRDSKLISASR